MAENLAIEGRYSVRAPMQWSAEPQAGFTTAREACRPLVEEGPFGFHEVNVTDQRRTLAVPRGERDEPEARPELDAQLDGAPHPPPPRVPGARLGQMGDARRRGRGGLRAPVRLGGLNRRGVHNLSGRDASVRLVLGGEGELVDLFQDEDHDLEEGEVTLELPPYGARWFRVRRPGARLPP